MAHYKLDYFSTPDKAVINKRNRQWAASFVAGALFLVFILLFFGGIGTAFRYREQHQLLRQQHDALRLRYDSLYAAKLQVEKELVKAKNGLPQQENQEFEK
ncbi:hypothetical protein [Runella sp.]|uniref:hypothetical protein n=1 Tax=Runella sp. TaxID=1960881 RepID=UPI003D11D80A